jgi:zinc D-Ala-D-Ala dipeptidase
MLLLLPRRSDLRVLLLALAVTAGLQAAPGAQVAPPAAPAAPGASFRIIPVRPVLELRADALAAAPPVEQGPFRDSELVDLVGRVPGLKLDVRYATADNFLGTPVYEESRAFLQRPAAEALSRVASELAHQGYGVIVFDAYRPWYVTKIFWDATPADKKEFVADPAKGSRHNRGCAVDLSLYDLASGRPVAMPSGYDEMTDRASPDYRGGTETERQHRDLLRRVMEAQGFTVYESEWWHFDYRDWQSYRIANQPFATLR